MNLEFGCESGVKDVEFSYANGVNEDGTEEVLQAIPVDESTITIKQFDKIWNLLVLLSNSGIVAPEGIIHAIALCVEDGKVIIRKGTDGKLQYTVRK